jgi:phosphotransferase system enzyme I (PtsI)
MKKEPYIVRGIVAARGMAIGHAVRMLDPLSLAFNLKIPTTETAQEVARFRASVEKSRKELKRLQARLKRSQSPESAFLVEAHILILQDRLFVDRIVETIESQSINAEWAVQQVSEELYRAYDQLQDDYLRERRGDLEDIVRRLLHNLQPRPARSRARFPADAVIVGRSVAPSTLFEMRLHSVVGVVAEVGSPLSHTAIMARSMGIPAVMGVRDVSGIMSGDSVIVDGHNGVIIAAPDLATLRDYRAIIRNEARMDRARRAHAPRKSRSASAVSATRDRARILLGANINFSEEVATASANGAEFIGLYRTEFDFFRNGSNPSEEALAADYTRALEAAKTMPVTFRTIDVGIDSATWDGANTHLGARGLRFCLENQELFKTQLRALFRASRRGKARILLPFVSTLDDLDSAFTIIEEVKADLRSQGEPHDPHAPIGVMIETPAAAQTCDLMAPLVDFFCVGTNDLIQYYLAIDRSDQSTAHLYTPFHPAILRCLEQIRKQLEPTGKLLTVCGEMASDPLATALLLGLGFKSLSVNLGAYSRIRQAIAAMKISVLRKLAAECLKLSRPWEVESRVRSSLYLGPGFHS